ncbi:MAG TPA: adenylate cyclase regulatory domain-containing protein [Solirubrobacteraceae bacterium]
MSAEPDFAGAGLLDGLDGSERDARLALLRTLSDEGCSLEQLRVAVAAGRLALLPVERQLGERQRHSLMDTARETGLSADFLLRNHTAIGLPRPDPVTPVYDDTQLENLRVLAGLLQAGFSEDDLNGIGRVLGEAARRIAEGFLDGLSSALIGPEDVEGDIALRYAALTRALLPDIDRLVGGVVRLHLLDVVRREAVGHVERATGRLSGGREVAVAFADLAGFTALSERVDVEELGALAARFERLVAGVAVPPVQLVKVLGDGAMLVSDDTAALVEAVLAVEQAAPPAGLPPVHAGVPRGPALRSAGDWYGRTVNLAARLCSAAGPGTVLVTPEVRAAAPSGFDYAEHRSLRVKGIEGAVAVLRVHPDRRPPALR